MKNLICFNRDSIESELIVGAEHMCVNPDDETVFLVNGNSELIKVIKTVEDSNSRHVIEKCCSLFPDGNSMPLIDIEYLLDENKVCLIAQNGSVFTVGPFFDPCDALEPCTEVPSSQELQSVAWSPDQELVLLFTSSGSFVLLDRSWCKVTEKQVNQREFGSGSKVNVGWGSKATQFHGSEGKSAREVKVINDQALEWDDRITRASWKRDGQMFAVSSVDEGRRVIRIWNRDAELQFTSELKDGLECKLNWRPSGELIATSQQHFNRHEVAFIEPNGQPLGSFILPDPCSSFVVKEILWSSDSSLLCLWGQYIQSPEQKLMLWTRSNYHWYLKRTYLFNGKQKKISKAVFDPVSGKTLHLVFSSGQYSTLSLDWSISQSSNNDIAVIDGSKLLVTRMSERIVPPPSYFYHLQFPESINDVSFDNESNGHVFRVLTSSNQVYRFSCERISQADTELEVSTETGQVSLSLSDFCYNCNNISQNLLARFYLKSSLDEIDSCQEIIHLKSLDSANFLTVSKIISGLISSHVVTFWTEHNGSCTFVHKVELGDCVIVSISQVTGIRNLLALAMADGKVGTLEVPNAASKPTSLKFISKFPQMCLDFCVKLNDHGNFMSIGLSSSSFSLFVNDTIFLKHCVTSFLIYADSHLIVTTNSNTLHIWSLDHVLSISGQIDVLQSSLEKREIERGSRLVTGLPCKGSLILQASRGNLEHVTPRVLLWITISRLMNDERNFIEALELMRKNRMNLNLIHDQNANFFMENIREFVEQVSRKNIDYLVLFLTELSPQKYPVPGDLNSKSNSQFVFEESSALQMEGFSGNVLKRQDMVGKVEVISRKIREILLEDKERIIHFLNAILVTFFKCNKVAESLVLIKSLSDASTRSSAIEFLKYMVDINALFNEALATYDMEIVVMVAEKSNKDPKEYLKMVKDFNDIEPLSFRKFKIDLYLKKYEKALANISSCEGHEYFEEALQVIDKHRLYQKAIKIFRGQDYKVSRIWSLFGEYLHSKKYYNEAGNAFSKANLYLKAAKSYQVSGDWNSALRECIKVDSEKELKLLCISLIDSLTSSGKFIEASLIAEKYLNNVTQAILILIDGQEWDHVSRLLVTTSGKLDTIEDLKNKFAKQLLIHGKALAERISSFKLKLNEYYQMFTRLREERTKNTLNEDDFPDDTISEVGSDFSSSTKNSGSLRTRMTSGKASKKAKNKTLKLKEGSSYQDLALMQAYKEIVITIDHLQPQVALVLKHLVYLDNHQDFNREEEKEEETFVSIASSLSRTLDDVLNQVLCHQIPSIWTPDMIENILKRIPFLSLSEETETFLISKPIVKNVPWKSMLVL